MIVEREQAFSALEQRSLPNKQLLGSASLAGIVLVNSLLRETQPGKYLDSEYTKHSTARQIQTNISFYTR